MRVIVAVTALAITAPVFGVSCADLRAHQHAVERTLDHLTDSIYEMNETNMAAIASALVEYEAGRTRVREIEERAPFPAQRHPGR